MRRRIGPWNLEKEQRLFGLNKKESHKDGWSGDLTEIQMDEMVEKWNEDISKLQNMTSSNRVTSSCSSGNRSPNVSSQNTTPFSSSQTSNRDVRDVRDVQVGLNRIFAQRGRPESGAPPNATIHSNTVSIRNPASRATTDLEALESSIALELRNLMSTMSGSGMSGHPNRDELQVTFRDLLRSTAIGRVLILFGIKLVTCLVHNSSLFMSLRKFLFEMNYYRDIARDHFFRRKLATSNFPLLPTSES